MPPSSESRDTPAATRTPQSAADPETTDILVVLSTWPSPDQAAEAARTLVDEGLAACVNLVPQVRSIYRWQGAVTEDVETLALVKTTRASYAALAARLVSLHPYEVPELIALPIVLGHAPYLAWLTAATR